MKSMNTVIQSSIKKHQTSSTPSPRKRVGVRFRTNERLILDNALHKGYLEVYPWYKENIKNLYLTLCSAHKIPAIICFHGRVHHHNEHLVLYQSPEHFKSEHGETITETSRVGTPRTEPELRTSRFATAKEAKLYAKSLRSLSTKPEFLKRSSH